MNGSIETEIRALVRELLREVVPAGLNNGAPRDETRPVRISDDADLAAFALRVLDLARDPAAAEGIRTGRISFRLAGRSAVAEAAAAPVATAASAASSARPATTAAAASAQPGAPILRIDKGAVTEKIVASAAASGARLVLGPRAVLTPLAKEGARKHGVGIERAS